jgi:hypothetical protein
MQSSVGILKDAELDNLTAKVNAALSNPNANFTEGEQHALRALVSQGSVVDSISRRDPNLGLSADGRSASSRTDSARRGPAS